MLTQVLTMLAALALLLGGAGHLGWRDERERRLKEARSRWLAAAEFDWEGWSRGHSEAWARAGISTEHAADACRQVAVGYAASDLMRAMASMP